MVRFLTHWGWVTHVCAIKLTISGSDHGLSPGRRQAIIWTIAGTLLIGPLETDFSEILIDTDTFSFKKMHLKMACGKFTEPPPLLPLPNNIWTNQCRFLDMICIVTSLAKRQLIHPCSKSYTFKSSSRRYLFQPLDQDTQRRYRRPDIGPT